MQKDGRERACHRRGSKIIRVSLLGFDVSWQASDGIRQSDDLEAQAFKNPRPILAPVV